MADKTLRLQAVTVGSYQENCYVLHDESTKQCIVFDPGAEPERILTLIGDSTITAILITHAHGDHVGAIAALKAATGAPVSIHPAELPMLAPIHHDSELQDGDVVMLGKHRIHAVHTPGHAPGMLSFIIDDQRVIVGDTIFGGGPGRTASAADFHTTLTTLRDIILHWPDTYICYPGHGDSFRLGDIRERIRGFVAQDHGANFHGDAEW